MSGHAWHWVDPGLGVAKAGFTTARRRYRWRKTVTAEQWAGLVGTFADHTRLGTERLATLQGELSPVIDRMGGVVDVHGGTYVLTAGP